MRLDDAARAVCVGGCVGRAVTNGGWKEELNLLIKQKVVIRSEKLPLVSKTSSFAIKHGVTISLESLFHDCYLLPLET